MSLRTKITILTTAIAVSVGMLIIVSIRGEIINAFRGELEKRAVSIAWNLSDRIANHILLKDYFQTTKAINEVMVKEVSTVVNAISSCWIRKKVILEILVSAYSGRRSPSCI
jgi:sensor histidine kinase regulating citrate/malate metabolism